MRIGEALALTWADVDFENGAIRVLRSGKPGGDGSTKGGRFRATDFGPRLANVRLDLKAREQEHGAGVDGATPVFPGAGRCYGHLEATFLKGAAAETEAAIWGPPPAR